MKYERKSFSVAVGHLRGNSPKKADLDEVFGVRESRTLDFDPDQVRATHHFPKWGSRCLRCGVARHWAGLYFCMPPGQCVEK